MNKETRLMAKEIYAEDVARFGRPIPRTPIGWFIKLHITDEGQFAIWNAKSELEAIHSRQLQDLEVDSSPEPLQ